MPTQLSTIDEPTTERCFADRSVASSGDTPLRVLQVINGEHYAGAERVQDVLAMRLPELDVEVAFACLKPDRFAGMRQSRATPLYELPMRSRWDIRPAYRLARLVQSGRYDVLHTHSARALLIARLAAPFCSSPIVHHVHGHTGSEIAGRRFTRANAWVERRTMRAAQAVIAVSDSVSRYLRSCGVADERLRIVANGVPMRATFPHKAAAPAHWTIGFIALLRPRKGLEVFLDAVALIKSRGLPIRLRIVGRFETAGYEEEIHRRAGELGLAGIIDWRGFQQHIDTELDAMDLLAFPSVLPEGMPMVVLEAMAAGVPIVASEVNGVVDVLRDQKSALLVSPGDAESLANALSTLVEDQRLRDRLRLSAFDQQREQFSDYSMAAAVAAIYRNIVVPKGAAR